MARYMKKIIVILQAALWSMILIGFMLFVTFLAGIQTLAVLSGSMEPAIHTGSIVFINTHEQTPKQGEIITYCLGEIKVTHRVKSIQKNGRYETKGDANELSDPEYVRKEQILGTVVGSIPYLGFLLMYLRSSKLFICLACLLLIEMCRECLIDRK